MGEAPHAGRFHYGFVTERYDVIVVGSGAGGGTLAHTLAPSGKQILLLERGDFLVRELDNLYVVDTSFFPSIGAVNPALTAMANAIRVGEHVLSRMA
jgi:choline dehydrogenase-like flavoprotein